MDAQLCLGLVINAPEFFADTGFQQWLISDQPKFSWYKTGPIDEWADIVVLVDPSLSGEGSDSDMRPAIWDQIIALCRDHLGPGQDQSCHYMVRLTNLTE